MTEGSSFGSMDMAPVLNDKTTGGAWSLWESIAGRQQDCGNPSNFTGHVDESKWVSFTVTLKDPALFDAIRELTGNIPGEGGLVTFPASSWLMSIVLPYQPHFITQPANVQMFWAMASRSIAAETFAHSMTLRHDDPAHVQGGFALVRMLFSPMPVNLWKVLDIPDC